jgi:hypothetical protein
MGCSGDTICAGFDTQAVSYAYAAAAGAQTISQ